MDGADTDVGLEKARSGQYSCAKQHLEIQRNQDPHNLNFVTTVPGEHPDPQ